MSERLSVGDLAPNFDLTSTEDVVLMLCDEVPRLSVVLYFFTDPAGDRERGDLAALRTAHDRLRRRFAVVLGISPADVESLKVVQKELGLPFPLLQDDRDFSTQYGIGQADSALFVIDRRQKVMWMANPLGDAEAAIGTVLDVLQKQPTPTGNYPRSVVNRIVDWWVNKKRSPRVA